MIVAAVNFKRPTRQQLLLVPFVKRGERMEVLLLRALNVFLGSFKIRALLRLLLASFVA